MSELAVSTLQAVSVAHDTYPPLKSAADGALWIANTVKTNKHAKAEWAAFANYIQQGVACVTIVANKDNAPIPPALEAHLRVLETAVDTITRDMRTRMMAKSLIKRARYYFRDRSRIRLYTTTVDKALALFNLGSTVSAQHVFAHLLENSSSILSTVAHVPEEVSRVGHGVVRTLSNRANLDLLPYASGAAWNPQQGVLPGTRTALLDEVMQFVHHDSSSSTSATGAQVLVLEGPAGVGKTSLANSIAKACAEAEDVTLLSSFFYNKGVAGRDSPDLLLSTIAHDLAKKLAGGAPGVADMISAAIERDKSLLSPPLAQQFEHLILRPATTFLSASAESGAGGEEGLRARAASEATVPSVQAVSTSSTAPPVSHNPLVIVIDALDEGYSDDLLRILAEGVPNLPPCFRIIITTRPSLPISSALRPSPAATSAPLLSSFSFTEPHRHTHITTRSLVQDDAYREDVATYARHMLAKIRDMRRLGDAWPGEELEDQFAALAREGGLFAWVSIVGEFLLSRSVNPKGQFERLVSPSTSAGAGGEADVPGMLEKMDALYVDVLASAPWEDEEFVQAYESVFASLLCVKKPLSAKSLDAVLGRGAALSAADALRPLSSVVTGLNDQLEGDDTPLQVVHPSLRDFVARRARTSSDASRARFAIDTHKTEESLALRTLSVLNEQLPSIFPPSHAPSPAGSTGGTPPGTPKASPSPVLRPRLLSFNYPSVSFLGAGAPSAPSGSTTLPSPPPSPARSMKVQRHAPMLRNRTASDAPPTNGTSLTMRRAASFGSQMTTMTSGTTHSRTATAAAPMVITSFNEPASLPELETAEAEALEYAMRFWLDHLCASGSEFGQDVLDALAKFLHPGASAGDASGSETNLMRWIRLVVHYQSQHRKTFEASSLPPILIGKTFEALRSWCKAADFDLWGHVDRAQLATYLHALSVHLRSQTQDSASAEDGAIDSAGCLDSAIDVLHEAISLRRELVHDRPDIHTSELATSLHMFSDLLTARAQMRAYHGSNPELVNKEGTEALAAIHEAVTLRRKLASAWPALYSPVLAGSLHDFAQRLEEVGEDGCGEEAEMARLEEKMLLSIGGTKGGIGEESTAPSGQITPPVGL